MADDEHDTELMRRWWLRMRRSFAIPDIVTDEHAIEAIMGLAVPESIRLDRREEIVTRIVGVLLRLASHGELDQYVIGDIPGPSRKQKPVLELCHDVVTRVHQHPRLGNFDRSADEVLEDATMAIIDRMTTSIAAMPFESGDGRYFRAVTE
ncbi:MAG TPA: hypothetical protein VNV87_13455 [Acidimicrobiales bacterium]|nr:hypothetical protein [Acidimicrobiales bacterium]